MAQVSGRERKTGTGMVWTIGRALVQLIAGIGVGVALARLLPPRDFGLIAIANGFGVMAEALALAGLGSALIQRPTIRRATVEATLLVSLLLASGWFVLFWLAAPWVARWYAAPELIAVLKIVGITQGVMTLGIVPRAVLRRQLRHRTLAAIDLVSYLVGYAAVSITLAWFGWGVLSLALGLLAWWSATTIALWLWGGSKRWRPRWTTTDGWAVLRYGLTLSGKSVVVYLGGATSSLLLGWLVGPEALGLFQRAAQLALIPLQRLASTIGHVLFPAYALIQDQPEKLHRALLDGQKTLALVCFPIMTVFVAVPETVIDGLYGENWRAAAPLLRILAIVVLVDLTHHLLGPLAEACGLAVKELRLQLAYVTLLALTIALSAPFGLIVIGWAHLLPAIFLNVSIGWLMLPTARINWRQWIWTNRSGLMLGVGTACAALFGKWLSLWILPHQPVTVLLSSAVCSALVYFVGLWRIPGPHQQAWRRSTIAEAHKSK